MDGNLAIGVTTPSAQLHTSSTVRFANFTTGSATFDASGNISSVSDERYKHIQREFATGMEAIDQINPIVYKWRDNSGMETEHEYA